VSDPTVGSYVLVEKLGEGGMGEVYLAEHKYIARRAAIKFLLRDLSGSADLVGRFFAEARAASVIKHPGIVEVLDCDVHDGRAYIVMELLRGESLRDYLARVVDAGRDEAGALAMFWQIGSALAAAHAQDIVHRDLKPDNIYLHVAEGQRPAQPIPKVLDFGIAKLMGRGVESGTNTRTGQLMGTPMYMSPEQCRGLKQVDRRSDIYSVGCIMYEVFCGRPPFLGEGFGDLIIAHASQPPPEPLELAPWMSAGVRQVLLACLAKDPRERPQSMDELMIRLAEAGAPATLILKNPVMVFPGGGRSRPPSPSPASSPDDRTMPAPGALPRLAQTTPMSAAPLPAAASASVSAAGRPVMTPGAMATPAGVGRTRFLKPEKTDPNTLHEGASERFSPTLRARGRGGKLAMVVGGAGAVALAAIVLIRMLAAPSPAPAGKEPGAETAAAPGAPVGEAEHRAGASPPAATPSSTSTPTPTPTSGASASAAGNADGDQSSIELTGLPPGATLHLDGRLVTPPIRVPRRAEPHRLVIEASGYQRTEVAFDGARDRTLAFEATPIGPVTSPVAAGKLPAVKPIGGKPHKRSDRPPHESPGFKAFTDL
jgi:eukaryotic-like serine/threonine-protein kinase